MMGRIRLMTIFRHFSYGWGVCVRVSDAALFSGILLLLLYRLAEDGISLVG